MHGPFLFNAGTQDIDLMLKRNPLKMAKLQRPTRNIIYACIALAVMTFLWHRMRAPLQQTGGLIASPPQHEDVAGSHAIVKFKNIKKLPKGVITMNDIPVDNGLQPGRDASIYSEARKGPPQLASPASQHLKDKFSHSTYPSRQKQPQRPSRPAAIAKPSSNSSPHTSLPKAKIAKVSMLYGSHVNSIYDIAMETQEAYASFHDYPMHILRREIMPSCRGLPVNCNPRDAHNLAGMWNKELYLLSILTAELTKPDSERIDWLMWQDGDSIIVNPSIPLEIFLPPSTMFGAEDIHLLTTKDGEGLNSGVFFLRVSPLSVRFLTACTAVPMTVSPDEPLGWSYDQSAMAKLIEENEEFKGGVLWQPRRWYNAYNIEDMYAPGEEAERGPEAKGARGKVLNVHFPGMTGDQRVPVMAEWLQKLEEEEGWDVAVEETGLLEEVEEFWSELKKGEAKELRRAKQS